MNIVKATLRQLLNARWKFCLVVALFGVALVVLTHASDVAGTLERIIATDDAVGTAQPEDQADQLESAIDAFALLALYGALAALFSLGAVLVGFLMPGGIVANERQSSAIMLWAQHPMSLTRFYGQRYLGIQLGNLAAQALFGILAVIAVMPRVAVPAEAGTGNPGIPSTETGLLVEICLSGALACAISFAITALGMRRAALLALAYYFGSSLMGGIFSPASPLVPDSLAWLQDLLPFVIFPDFQLQGLVAGFDPEVAWDWKATGMVLYHFALWTAVALLGLRRTERRPIKL